jgi:rhodanese-related sulfurtransferase
MPSNISASDLDHLLKSNSAPHVIDVREPSEFAAVHVESARLFPLDDLQPEKIVAALGVEPGQTIYILCKSGRRASKAAEKFRAKGISNICVVEGGTDACVEAGLALTVSGAPI